jgi:hypothetical protein
MYTFLVQLANVLRRALLQGSGKGTAILTCHSTVLVGYKAFLVLLSDCYA